MNRLFILLSLLVLYWVSANAQAYSVFTFHMTQMGSINAETNTGSPVSEMENYIEVNLFDNAENVIVGAKTNGKGYKLGEFGDHWYINKLGALEVKNTEGHIFLVDNRKCVINVSKGNTVIIFTEPGSRSEFTAEYDRLLVFLKKYGKVVDETNTSAQTSQKTNAKAASSVLKRPALVPSEYEVCHTYDLRNTAYRNKDGIGLRHKSKFKDFGIVDIAQLVEHPAAIKELDWNDSDIKLLAGLVQAGIDSEALYKTNSYGNVWTYIDLNAAITLPSSMTIGGQEVRLSTKQNSRPSLVLTHNNNGTVSINASMAFYTNYSGGSNLSYEYREKNVNRALEKYFNQFVDILKSKGYNLKKENKYEYSIKYNDYLTGNVVLDLSKNHADNYSKIRLYVFKYAE